MHWYVAGTTQVEVMVCSQGVTYPLKAFLGHRVKKYALLNMDKTDKQAVMGKWDVLAQYQVDLALPVTKWALQRRLYSVGDQLFRLTAEIHASRCSQLENGRA